MGLKDSSVFFHKEKIICSLFDIIIGVIRLEQFGVSVGFSTAQALSGNQLHQPHSYR